MKSYRENPDGEENQKASRQIDREIFALKMQAKREAEGGREEEEDDEQDGLADDQPNQPNSASAP